MKKQSQGTKKTDIEVLDLIKKTSVQYQKYLELSEVSLFTLAHEENMENDQDQVERDINHPLTLVIK